MESLRHRPTMQMVSGSTLATKRANAPTVRMEHVLMSPSVKPVDRPPVWTIYWMAVAITTLLT